MRFQLQQFLLDFVAHGSERSGGAALSLLDLQDVIIAAEFDNVADPFGRKIKCHLLQRRSERLPLNPAPVASQIARTVFRINLGHSVELGAPGQLFQNFLGHRFLGGRVAVAGVRRDHNHAKFHLLLGRELLAVRIVIILNLGRGGDHIAFHILGAHGLHDHAFALHPLEFAQRIILSLQRFNKCVPIAPEILVDDLVHPLIDVMIGDLVVLFLEGLDDQLAIDQILEPELADFPHFFDQFLAGELRTQLLFARDDQRTHLRIGDDVTVHDRGDAIDDLGGLAIGGKTEGGER